MSWLFSQALAAEFSAGTSWAGEPSAPSSSTPMQRAFLSHGKTTAFSLLSRFGMMCAPLTDTVGEALLTSYLEASRARTSAQPELARELPGGVEVASGAKWPALSVRFDPDSSSWKMAHCLWEEDFPSSSVILPRWGMTRSGHVFQHPTAERPISVTASGLLANPRRWPTPKANDAEKRGNFDMYNPRNGFPAAVMRYPTPTASASKGWSKNHNRANTDDRLDYTIERQAFRPGQQTPPKRLNPEWVEWLMGWPPGWTDLKPLAMDRFREWQQQHSPYSADNKEAA